MNIAKQNFKTYLSRCLSGLNRRLTRKINNLDTQPSNVLWTEYLGWLNFVNAGMLARGNVWCMDYAIKNLPSDAPLVEIGSFCGLSTNVITYLKERNNAKNLLITCDKWILERSTFGKMLADSKSITFEEYQIFTKDTFLHNVKMFSRNDLPYAIELFSDEFFKEWENGTTHNDVLGRTVKLGGTISFCYIDGNHKYDFARRDFDNCDKFLEKGGFILFDDSADFTKMGVCKVVKEVIETQRYDLIAKNPHYFFRKK